MQFTNNAKIFIFKISILSSNCKSKDFYIMQSNLNRIVCLL